MREDIDVHLATCPECSGELARYRELMGALASLRDDVEIAPVGMPERIVASVLSPRARIRAAAARAAQDRRVHVAAASLGGALVGGAAIALVWWRIARRGLVARAA